MGDLETKNLAESHAMVGGYGAQSYAKNSSYQRAVVNAAKEMVKDAIADKLDFKTLEFDASNTFKIADLGCSTGSNTFIAVQNILESVEQNYLNEHQNPSTLEFQVFFNDHYDNDFNTLFKTLPPSRKYFATGVPGSFYSRLFPKSTLHFVYSSYALHWLSKVPQEIVDSKSPAWNKGSIQCTGFVKEVAKAYAAQFKNDMECFLNARAEELVGGGLMVIVISTLPNGIPMSNTAEGKIYDLLGSCLIDLVKMGLISEEKVDSFNFPLYYPTCEELEEIIHRNGLFSTERMKVFAPIVPGEMTFSAERSTSQIRAVFEGLMKEHFGGEFIDQIFNNFTAKQLEETFLKSGVLKNHNKIDLFIALKRIMN
ncbi:hypothetical protein Pint_18681 [Pistacia integerrima]|uniref:Uncharacterized protein n=1 Tax=Pistacia integerrima TaxID=434235 RepID=A0ACC0YWL5_9ROSI|nr:hypothetical protein Pint_18681 [Pistacia integerrima]